MSKLALTFLMTSSVTEANFANQTQGEVRQTDSIENRSAGIPPYLDY